MAVILAHRNSPVTFNAPQPPASTVPDPPCEFRLHLAETPEDGRRPVSSDPVQRRLDMQTVAMLAGDRCGAEALVTVLKLAERYGIAAVLTWTKNLAAIHGLER